MKTIFTLAIALIACAMTSFTTSAQITITFNVNMTGQFIADGGMHIAGQFASDASMTILTDWTPDATGSVMSLQKGNVYSVQVTFPNSSVGEQLQFLFVRDSIWNDCCTDYSEGNPGVTHLDPSCGASDGFGGFNRLITIPSSNAVLNADWDYCGIMTVCNAPSDLHTNNITSTSAQLNWRPVDGGKNYTIQYRKEGEGWNRIQGVSLQNTRYTITGLTAGSNYEWQMLTSCQFAPSVWAQIVPFKTSAAKFSVEGETGEVEVYPNPAANVLSMKFSDNSESVVQIINDFGQVIYAGKLNSSNNTINIRTLTPGIYYLKVIGEKQNATIPFSVVK